MVKTLNIPDSQAELLNQLVLTLGWTFQSERSSQIVDTEAQCPDDELSPLVKHFKRGTPSTLTDEEWDKLRYEYLKEKYK